MSHTQYVICLEGNGQCAAYESQRIAEEQAKRLSLKAGAHFIAVPVPPLHAQAQAMRSLLELLTMEVEHANALQHAGTTIPPRDWSCLYDLTNRARALLRAVEGEGK